MKYFKKGFTVAELLIVCAIVAILVAISIPILNVQLEKAREAHDIATMRTAASAAIDLYYAGVHDNPSALKAGISWDTGGGKEGANAYGAYDPRIGKIVKDRAVLGYGYYYGKGTKVDGGTVVPSGNEYGKAAYLATEDYTKAVVLVSIYPNSSKPHVDIYWKTNTGSIGQYIGDRAATNIPKYSLRYYFN
ncbi:MAG: prepilin-type N-terminal cleavage/methylation domain-containing protein [Oribacterium sp.]|nr:prepilin-type N-terminal cleavage/methylation domain-containing protein [Oribacterium sp.]MBP3802812.1 prepilin-type N-terminal cleavage/methylation domain-containing protein [Oribacterium sp.]